MSFTTYQISYPVFLQVPEFEELKACIKAVKVFAQAPSLAFIDCILRLLYSVKAVVKSKILSDLPKIYVFCKLV